MEYGCLSLRSVLIQDDYETPTVSRTAPNEEIYTQPDINEQNREDTTDDITYQNLLKPDSEYAYPTVPETAPYEYMISPASVNTKLDTSQQHQTASDHTNQKMLKYDPEYVVPADGDDETEPYEEVGIEKTHPGCTKLDTNQRH